MTVLLLDLGLQGANRVGSFNIDLREHLVRCRWLQREGADGTW